jgi:hypothetical protein
MKPSQHNAAELRFGLGRLAVVCGLLGLTSLLAVPARAGDWQLDLGSYALQPVTDAGQRLATPNLHGFELGAEAEVAPDLLVGVRWWLATGSSDPDVGQTGTFDGQTLQLSAKWRRKMSAAVAPYARVGLGAMWGRAEVSDSRSAVHADMATPVADAVAGVELTLPRLYRPDARWKPTVGLTFEAGWMHALSQNLQAESPIQPLAGVQTDKIALGDLTWSGWTARLGFVIRL